MLPKNRRPTHPGEVLLEGFLKPMNLSQASLASHLGWPYARVNEIVKEKRGITPETALAFSDSFGTTAEFWLNLQLYFDLWAASMDHQRFGRIRKSA
jgi:addiction module HigA family antidote